MWKSLEESVDRTDTNDELEEENLIGRNQTLFGFPGSNEKLKDTQIETGETSVVKRTERY